MVIFKELRVNKEGSKLIIDVEIPDYSWNNTASIVELYVHTDTTFISDTQTSDNAVYINKTFAPLTKTVRLELDSASLNNTIINKALFFIFVRTNGVSTSAPPEYQILLNMGAAVNLYPFYQRSVIYMRDLTKDCTDRKAFIDFILRMKALENYIYTGHYSQAVLFWTKYFKESKEIIPFNTNCACYG